MASGVPPIELTLRLIAGILLILINAFLVAVEFGLTRARQYPKEEFVDSGSRGLKKAWEMTEELEIYLTSCQVGISATSIALGVIAEPALAALFNPLFEDTIFASFSAGVILAFLVINIIHLTHGEQTPTYLGVEKSKLVCKYGSIPLYWYTWTIRPIISIGDTVAKATLSLFGIKMTSSWVETGEETIRSRSQLRNHLQSMLNQQELTEERIDEVISVLDADNIQVSDVMVLKEDISALSTENSTEENRQVIQESERSRYPLVGESINDFKGIVYMAALARESYGSVDEVNLENISAPVMTLDAETSVSTAIDQFQMEEQEMALVVDNSGDIIGLITITDLLEELIGEIEDPLD
jgi:CBS domain containing-hemolysin-like protein